MSEGTSHIEKTSFGEQAGNFIKSVGAELKNIKPEARELIDREKERILQIADGLCKEGGWGLLGNLPPWPASGKGWSLFLEKPIDRARGKPTVFNVPEAGPSKAEIMLLATLMYLDGGFWDSEDNGLTRLAIGHDYEGGIVTKKLAASGLIDPQREVYSEAIIRSSTSGQFIVFVGDAKQDEVEGKTMVKKIIVTPDLAFQGNITVNPDDYRFEDIIDRAENLI